MKRKERNNQAVEKQDVEKRAWRSRKETAKGAVNGEVKKGMSIFGRGRGEWGKDEKAEYRKNKDGTDGSDVGEMMEEDYTSRYKKRYSWE